MGRECFEEASQSHLPPQALNHTAVVLLVDV